MNITIKLLKETLERVISENPQLADLPIYVLGPKEDKRIASVSISKELEYLTKTDVVTLDFNNE